MGQSPPLEVFFFPALTLQKKGGGPHQTGAFATVTKNERGGPWQPGAVVAVTKNERGGPHQGNAPAAVLSTGAGGPHQGNAPASVQSTGAGGPHQGNASQETADMGNIEGRSDKAHTRPGGLGMQVNGVNASEQDTVNFIDTPGVSWQVADNPAQARADVTPTLKGVVEIGRFTVDLTALPSTTLISSPAGPTFALGITPHSMSVRAIDVTGITLQPSISLGNAGAGWDQSIPQTQLDLAAAGDVRRYEVAATPLVALGQELRVNHSIQGNATTYSVEIVVYGQAA